MSSETDYRLIPDLPSTVVREEHIEHAFIWKHAGLKYTHRPDIRHNSYHFANNNARHFDFNADEVWNNARMFVGETELSLLA